MIYSFQNAAPLLEGIALVADELGITMADEHADITVTTCEVDQDILTVALDGKNAVITYGGGNARFFRGLALLHQWVKEGITTQAATAHPLFTVNGAMVDMSRDAVMNVATVKFILRKMALMGLNSFMLYTEDTYEVENHPYFGYMRGRYTPDEIRELDGYAQKLGIELIPCIQVLGHLATTLRWEASAPFKDTSNALLVGADATYQLIDDMFRTISKCFTSKRLHIGMDETHDLGVGKYLDLNGYRARQDIFLEHLAKVVEMAKGYGFRPMMWSDMFFRLAGKDLPGFEDYDMRTQITEDIIRKVPQGVQQIFWDYYHPEEEFYAVNIDKHALLGENTMFAGGVWQWSGHCPHFSRSLRNSIPALDACRKKGIKEVIATIWHNGAEASLILALAGLAWYADYDYKGYYCEDSVKECFRAATGLDYEQFLKTELPEYPHGGQIGISRALLYNDPMVGLIDKNIQELDTGSYYHRINQELAGIGEDTGVFAPAFAVIRALSDLLEKKADFGVRLKKAYDRGDKETLAAMAKECDVMIEKIKALQKAHKASWMEYNKPFGWEVHDIRYGGMLMRFDTAKERILDYLNGTIPAIEELEAERLYMHASDVKAEDKIGGTFLWNSYTTIATANII